MPKLPRGMIRRKLKSGRVSYYHRRQENGRDRWISLGLDRGEACRKFREVQRGGITRSERVTVAQAAKEWLDTYVKNARVPYGQQLALRRVEMYLSEHMGYRLVQKVSGEDLRRYRSWLEKQGQRGPLSPQSVKHILSDARCFFNWCEDTGLVAKSPFPRRLLPKIQERPPDRLTDEEVDCLSGLKDPFGFIIRLGVGTGLRWGEMARAQASDLEGERLLVRRSKNGKIRRVPIPPKLLAELRLRVGRLVPFSEKSSDYVTRVLRRESGINRFHLHQLRHTYGCRWVENGGSPAAL